VSELVIRQIPFSWTPAKKKSPALRAGEQY